MPNTTPEIQPPLQPADVHETKMINNIQTHTEKFTGQPQDLIPPTEKHDKIQIFVNQVSQPKEIAEEKPKTGFAYKLDRVKNLVNTAIWNKGGVTESGKGRDEEVERAQKKAELQGFEVEEVKE